MSMLMRNGFLEPVSRAVSEAASGPSDSRLWRWASVVLAAIAVIAGLLLIQDRSGEPAPAPSAESAAAGADGPAPNQASFVNQPGFSLALPPSWKRVEPEGGAAFAARAVDGTADATLWIDRNPGLSFLEFEAGTAERLRSLSGGEVKIVERIKAPTADGTVVRLRADAPSKSAVSAPYDVTLRATGPYRYYLATTVLPGASHQASEGADLIHGSFVPEKPGSEEIETGATPGSHDGVTSGSQTPGESEIP
jgi:hypothetical protein